MKGAAQQRLRAVAWGGAPLTASGERMGRGCPGLEVSSQRGWLLSSLR